MSKSDFDFGVDWDNLDSEVLLVAEAEATNHRKEFCENWGCSRKGLIALGHLVKHPFFRCVLTCVIRMGDAVFNRACR